MMHHGILEHYTGQNQLDPGYVIDDYETVAHDFTEAGLNIMFTGHYHANDIVSRTDGDKILYDIETGSMVTAPIPYRIITLKGSIAGYHDKIYYPYCLSTSRRPRPADLCQRIPFRSPGRVYRFRDFATALLTA